MEGCVALSDCSSQNTGGMPRPIGSRPKRASNEEASARMADAGSGGEAVDLSSAVTA